MSAIAEAVRAMTGGVATSEAGQTPSDGGESGDARAINSGLNAPRTASSSRGPLIDEGVGRPAALTCCRGQHHRRRGVSADEHANCLTWCPRKPGPRVCNGLLNERGIEAIDRLHLPERRESRCIAIGIADSVSRRDPIVPPFGPYRAVSVVFLQFDLIVSAMQRHENFQLGATAGQNHSALRVRGVDFAVNDPDSPKRWFPSVQNHVRPGRLPVRNTALTEGTCGDVGGRYPYGRRPGVAGRNKDGRHAP